MYKKILIALTLYFILYLLPFQVIHMPSFLSKTLGQTVFAQYGDSDYPNDGGYEGPTNQQPYDNPQNCNLYGATCPPIDPNAPNYCGGALSWDSSLGQCVPNSALCPNGEVANSGGSCNTPGNDPCSINPLYPGCQQTSQTCEQRGLVTCPTGCSTDPTCGAGTNTNGSRCGDGTCSGGETSATCPIDCNGETAPGVCGNGICDQSSGETTGTCPQDCGTFCGNGLCDNGETSSTCPNDCPVQHSCNASLCEVWNGSSCTSQCSSNQTCQSGVCVNLNSGNSCSGCQSWNGAMCVDNSANCSGGQICSGGVCVAPSPTPTGVSCPGGQSGSLCCASGEEICNNACVPAGSCNSGGSCGNGICDNGETPQSCPGDCHSGGGGNPTSTPTPTTPQATATPPSGLSLFVSVKLPGIGKEVGDNKNPKHPSRSIHVQLSDANNNLAASSQGTVAFNGTMYTGYVQLPSTVTAGAYTTLLRMDNTLWRQAPGIVQIQLNTSNAVQPTTLVSGDITGDQNTDQDNRLDLADYNTFLGCFDNSTTGPCALADFNDDGIVDEVDINILQQGFAIINGDRTPFPSPSGNPTPTGNQTNTCHTNADCSGGATCQNTVCSTSCGGNALPTKPPCPDGYTCRSSSGLPAGDVGGTCVPASATATPTSTPTSAPLQPMTVTGVYYAPVPATGTLTAKVNGVACTGGTNVTFGTPFTIQIPGNCGPAGKAVTFFAAGGSGSGQGLGMRNAFPQSGSTATCLKFNPGQSAGSYSTFYLLSVSTIPQDTSCGN